MLIKCLQIFAARIVDVSLGTLRTVYFVKGKSIEPFIIAFFEVLVWYLVAKEALNTEGNTILIAISYASGYATGTYIGSILSNYVIKGVVGVQIVCKEDSEALVDDLRSDGFAVSVVNKNKLKELTKRVKNFDKNAFMAVNETKLVHNGLLKWLF